MKKWSIVLLILCCKFSFAQKINLPDSLPFTLEYIDSVTFANAKSINTELVRDTSDFKWIRDTLQLFANNKLLSVFINDNFWANPKFDSTKPQVETEIGKLYSPIGYYNINNDKLFVVQVSQWESGFNILLSANSGIQMSVDNIAINKSNNKFISTFYTPMGSPESNFFISSIPNLKILYSYQFDCSDKSAFEECNECICLWIQDKKWISDNDIYLQAVRFITNKKFYFKLSFK